MGIKRGSPRIHGHRVNGKSSRTYNSWANMIQRVTNPAHHRYPYYGGRGIEVCERWLKFENFYEDMGDRPIDMSLDRKDNDGDYEPSNCRWATSPEQNGNKRWRA